MGVCVQRRLGRLISLSIGAGALVLVGAWPTSAAWALDPTGAIPAPSQALPLYLGGLFGAGGGDSGNSQDEAPSGGLNLTPSAGEAPLPPPQTTPPPAAPDQGLDLLSQYVPEPGQWRLVPGTEFNGSGAVLTGNTGGAYDAESHFLYLMGGEGNEGNEVHRLDLEIVQTTQVAGPTLLDMFASCPAPSAGPTYDGIVWVPSTQTFFVFPPSPFCAGGSPAPNAVWEFDPATATWRAVAVFDPGAQVFAEFDPDTGQIVVIIGGDQPTIREFDPATWEFSDPISLNQNLPSGTAVLRPGAAELFVVSEEGVFSVSLTELGTIEKLDDLEDGVDPHSGAAFDPASGRLVLWDGSGTVRTYDPVSSNWARFEGNGPTKVDGGVFSKWVYLEALDAFAGYHNPAEGLWLYRLSNDIPGPSAPENQAPIADAGSNAAGEVVGHQVDLDGTDSADPDGDPLSYSWEIVNKPAASKATLSNAQSAKPSLVPDKVGGYVLRLTVSDGALSDTDQVTITAVNSVPLADAGSDQTLEAGQTASLDGGASSDPDGHALTYAWSLVSKPAGSTASLSDPTAAQPTLTLDVAGAFLLQLVVHDGVQQSAPDTVTVTAQAIDTQPAGDGSDSDSGGDSGGSSEPGAGNVIHLTAGQSFEAAVESLQPGDTLIVHAGTYSDTDRTSIQVKGTAQAPVVIKGADGEARPLITRPASASVQNTINVEGATHLTIKGLEVTGNGGDGIKLVGQPSHVTLEDLEVHDVEVALSFQSNMNNITVRNNHIYNTGSNGGTGEGMYVGCHSGSCAVRDSLFENNWIHDSLPGTTQGDGIEIKAGSYNNIVRNNVIHGMRFPCIFVYGGGPGTNIVEGNVLSNCGQAMQVVADAVVRNNIIFDSDTGITAASHEAVDGVNNVTIVNNTLYGHSDECLYIRWSGASNNVLANNAVYCPGDTAVNAQGLSGGGVTVSSNYVEGAMVGASIDNLGFVPGGAATDQFTSVAQADFWPTPLSMLREAADPSFAPDLDFNGTTRSGTDVGAYETEGLATNPGWHLAEGFKGVEGSNGDNGSSGGGSPANAAPIADAGQDMTIDVGQIAPLDGSASFDPDGDALTYVWNLFSRPQGSTATLSNPAAVEPSFVADVPGSYQIKLTVDDGDLSHSVAVTVVANALPDSGSGSGSGSGSDTGSLQPLKVAFIGDQGDGNDARAVLRMIEAEGANMVMHQGDFDYNDDPRGWDAMITQELGADFPYFASVGNHDTAAWSGPDGYQAVLLERLSRIPEASCSGDLGVQSACTYKGLFFILSGAGTIPDDPDNASHIAYITDQLAQTNARMRVCSWHKNQALMQVGGKGDDVGWGPYEACREGGAIVASAHEHSYSRTHLLDNFETQSIADTSSTLRIERGKTFAFVSGLGGQSIRVQQLDGPWWASIYTSDQGADHGALFCTFFVAGDPSRASCYFKAVDGAIPDQFEIVSAVTGAVANDAPVADAGADQTLDVGESATLDGSASFDPDGDALTYVWDLFSRPQGSSATLSDPTAVKPSFVADVPGAYQIKLTVDDGDLSHSAAVTVIANALPDSGSGSGSGDNGSAGQGTGDGSDIATDPKVLEVSGGVFTGSGWKTDSAHNKIVVDLGEHVEAGYVEFQIRGLQDGLIGGDNGKNILVALWNLVTGTNCDDPCDAAFLQVRFHTEGAKHPDGSLKFRMTSRNTVSGSSESHEGNVPDCGGVCADGLAWDPNAWYTFRATWTKDFGPGSQLELNGSVVDSGSQPNPIVYGGVRYLFIGDDNYKSQYEAVRGLEFRNVKVVRTSDNSVLWSHSLVSAPTTDSGSGSGGTGGGSGSGGGLTDQVVADATLVVDPDNRRWLRYASGERFFLCGPGDPEDFLYRGSRNADGTRSGDQAALIEKMAGTGANGIYIQMVRSHGGDGDSTHNPFVNSDPDLGLDEDILDQWESWFTAMDEAGIAIYLFFFDDSADIWGGGDAVPAAERDFLEAIVNRFKHHERLVWVIAEEYQEEFSAERVSNMAAVIRGADDVGHPIGVHGLSGLDFSKFADDPNVDQFLIQYNGTASQFHSAMVSAWNAAGGRYSLNMAEGHPDAFREDARRRAWAVAMGGAYVMHLRWNIASTPVADLRDCGRLVRFMESSNFDEMEPSDELAWGGTDYVLAGPSSYILYAENPSGEIGVAGIAPGAYDFRWLDVVTGAVVEQTGIAVAGGDVTWPRPAGIGNEVAVWIAPAGSIDLATADGPSPNRVPFAEAGANRTLDVGQTAVLNGGASSDPDGDALTYKWSLVSKPSGSTASLSASLTRTPSLLLDVAGAFVVSLVVSDGQATSTADVVTITAVTQQSSDTSGGDTGSGSGSSGFGAGDTNAAVQITNTVPTRYVWDTLADGKLAYIDRSYTYSGVPTAYQGLAVLRTANDDKDSSAEAFITFEIDPGATVYVAHDRRISSKPTWLSGWTATGDVLQTTDTTLDVFARNFPAGSVTLGGNGINGASMYTVVVGTTNASVVSAPGTDSGSTGTDSGSSGDSGSGSNTGSGGDTGSGSATPPITGSGGTLAQVAAGLSAGQSAVVATQNINTALSASGSSGMVFGYTDEIKWNPVARQLQYVGGDHGDDAQFVIYDEAKNTWIDMGNPSFMGGGTKHGYDHMAVDPVSGDFFSRVQRTPDVHRWNGQAWSTLPPVSDFGYTRNIALAIEYFPDMNGLLWAGVESGDRGGAMLWDRATNSWRRLAGDLLMGNLHHVAEYNPVHRMMIFGGGNGSRQLYSLDAQGNVKALAQAPYDVGIQRSMLTVDPVGGDFLVFFNNGELWTYNPTSDQWTKQSSAPPIWSNFSPPIHGVVATAVDTYGVNLFVTCDNGDSTDCRVTVYKHTGSPASGSNDSTGDAGGTSGSGSSSGDGSSGSTGDAGGTSGTGSSSGDSGSGSTGGDSASSGSGASGGTLSQADFAERCSGAGVILCDPLDSGRVMGIGVNDSTPNATLPEALAGRYRDWRVAFAKDGRTPPQMDTAIKASGDGSLKFTIESESPAGSSGEFQTNFTPDNSVQFGENSGAYYVQWRQRFSCDMLFTDCDPSSPTYKQERRGFSQKEGGTTSFKMVIVNDGDGPNGEIATSCTNHHIVFITGSNGAINGYHSCGWFDGLYDVIKVSGATVSDKQPGGINECWNRDPSTAEWLDKAWPDCRLLRADEWMTFEIEITVGAWTSSVDDDPAGSHIRLWMAREGDVPELIIDHDFNIRAPEDAWRKYGKVWLLPYMTRKDSTEVHPEAYTWYDELIVSHDWIPFPN